MTNEDTIDFNYNRELPICAHREEILSLLKSHPVVIVCGDTGSGKTTQLPKMAMELGLARIACTQPRRLAAVTVATRVAAELKTPLGALVGYQHRFARALSAATRVKFMTDGVLLAETRADPLLRAYDAIIIDEAHERTLNVDFLLGILKRILARRRDLKVIVSSATLDTEKFARFFDGAPAVVVPGRLFPIDIRYRPPADGEEADLPRDIAAALRTLPPADDVLVFLPGERDIRETADHLARSPFHRGDDVIPLLASLPAAEQQRAFRPSPKRRVILATNVAETSVTIPGIRAVIDSGLARLSRYVHRTQIQRLQIEGISQASARQRAGRCGRVGPGICIRLYSEEDFRAREAYTPPEVLRSSLAGVILTMLDLRLGEIDRFPFLDPPRPAMVRAGLRELLELGAIGHDRTSGDARVVLTRIGRALARIPVEPRLARMLLAAADRATLPSALPVVAAMSCDDPRRRPVDEKERADQAHAPFRVQGSDFLGTLRLWRWWQEQAGRLSQTQLRRLATKTYLSYPKLRDWQNLVRQLTDLARRLKLDVVNDNGGPDALHQALMSGLLGRLGHLDPERPEYRGAHALRFALHPGSILAKKRPDWIMAGELVDTSRLFARHAATIDPRWIERVAGDICKRSYRDPQWDAEHGFVRALEQVTLYGLVIVPGRRRDFSRIDPVTARRLFILHALVLGEFPHPPAPVRENLRLIAELRRRAERRRRPELMDLDRLAAFFDAAVPAPIVSCGELKKWLYAATPAEHARFRLKPAEWLTDAGASSADFPETIRLGNALIRLTYRHTPDDPETDGITATVRESDAPLLRRWRADWLVPGLLPEKVAFLLGALPSAHRRLLLPIADTTAILLPLLKPGDEPLTDALRRILKEHNGIRLPVDAFESIKLPPHLQMRFCVRSDDGKTTLVETRALNEIFRTCHVPPPPPPAPHASAAEIKKIEGEVQRLLWKASTLPQDIYDAIETQVAWLTFPEWARYVPAARIADYPRYFKAIQVRIDRARLNPASDRKKEERFAPFWEQYLDAATRGVKLASRAAFDDYRWLLEEYRISLFAQELGTAVPVSPQRLEIKWLEATEG